MKTNKRIVNDAGDARLLLDEIARHTVRRNVMVAACDEIVAEARARADLAYAAKIAAEDAELKAKISALKTWAVENEKTEFSDARSLSTPTGAFGFRTGMPKVELLRGWTIERAIAAIRDVFAARGWVRESWELNKEAIIADREKAAADLAEVGVRVKQGETFFVDVNLEEATKRYAY